MVAALGIMAGVIFLVYGTYFYLILKGRPEPMEIEILEAFVLWLEEEKDAAFIRLAAMLTASLILEIIYLALSFLLLHNPVMIILTLILAVEELLHIVAGLNSAHKYWRGQIEADRIINWIIERVSASFYFTHAFLVLVNILFFFD